ncbi:aspartate/glutamate racemase family protein [Mycolicibacterium sp. 624]|uniref:glutamate racemase n=1 Tax=Mycolicibacterium sp. 624 TaxID=3156314 RepID=UPI003392F410
MNDVRRAHARVPIVGVFDAGIGGLPLAAAIRRKRADVGIVYLADSARRPYGPQPQHAIKNYMAEVAAFFEDTDCDAWVVACNTASVAVRDLPAGRTARIDMVQAVQRAAADVGDARIGLLATASTVASGVMVEALPNHDVVQIATEQLLRLAEVGSSDHDVIRRLTVDAIAQLHESDCQTAILACTDFTAVLPVMREVAGTVTLIDPLEAAVELTLKTIPEPTSMPLNGDRGAADRLLLTGPHPVDVRQHALTALGLELPHPQIVTLPTPTTGGTT